MDSKFLEGWRTVNKPILKADGSNFTVWEDNLCSIFTISGIDPNKWMTKEVTISPNIFRILLCEELQQDFVLVKCSVEILKMLKARYSRGRIATIINCFKVINTLEGDTLNIVRILLKQREELKSLNVSLPDIYYISTLIDKLGPKFQSIILGLKEENTLEDVIGSVKQYIDIKEENDDTEVNKESAFFAKKKSEIICYYCKKKGHIAKNCFKLKYKEKNSGNVVLDEQDYGFINVDHVAMNVNSNEVLVDTGASMHVCRDRGLLSNIRSGKQRNCKFGGGEIMESSIVGQLRLGGGIVIDDVYWFPNAAANLLSAGILTNKKELIYSETLGPRYIKQGDKKVEILTEGTLFKIKIPDDKAYMVEDEALLWHRRLGHCNMKAVMTTVNVDGDANMKCDVCMSQKITKASHTVSFDDREVLETLYIDLGFPTSNIRTYAGNNCYLLGVDGYTKLTVTIPLPSKDSSTVLTALKKMIIMLESSTGKTIKNIRSDNGKEFKNSDVMKFLDARKICRQYTAVETPQQNLAERYNRTLKSMVRCIMYERKVPLRLWDYLIVAAAYVRNRIKNPETKLSPMEVAGLKYKIDHLRELGSVCFIKKPDQTNSFIKRSDIGIIVGFTGTSKAYKVFLFKNKKVVESTDILINEKENFADGLNHFKKYRQDEINKDFDYEDDCIKISKDKEKDLDENMFVEPERGVKRSAQENIQTNIADRTRSKKSKDDAYYVLSAMEEVPVSAIEAWKNPKWKEAMEEELQNMRENDAFEIVDREKDMKILPHRWVYSIKEGNKYKARLVIKGCCEKEEVDSFSPTSSKEAFKILMKIAVERKLRIAQLDVKSAFVTAEIGEGRRVYMHFPVGFLKEGELKEEKCIRLKKSLYGLKDSGRNFYLKMKQILMDNKFEPSEMENTIFINSDNKMILLLYVDDMLLLYNDVQIKEQFINKLEIEFKIKIVEWTNGNYKFLGIDVRKEEDMISISSESKINNIKEFLGYDIKANAPISREDITDVVESELLNSADAGRFRRIIGTLNYLAVCTRFDISYAISYLSGNMNQPRERDFRIAEKVLGYVIKSSKDCIVYDKSTSENTLEIYTDASYGIQSFIGVLIMLNKSMVYHKAKKLGSPVTSVFEAELMALEQGIKMTIWILKLLEEIQFDVKTRIFVDNKPLVDSMLNDGLGARRMKHIAIKLNFVKYHSQRFNIEYIGTEQQLADILTKPFVGAKLKQLSERIRRGKCWRNGV